MNYIKITTSIVLASVIWLMSCNDEFLNTKPLDKISSDLTWADAALSEAFIFSAYSYLGYGGFEEEMLASLSDEASFTHGRDYATFNEGTESPTNRGKTSLTYRWEDMYIAIRQTNIALAELPNSTFDDDVKRDQLMGEAHFLRAYYYHQLLRYYGGVPIIETPYGLNDDYSIARNTYEECVNFIISNLDTAAGLLDGKEETGGRASRVSALALKARVLLYAASDLADGPTAAAASSVLSGYSNPALISYQSGSQAQRWEAAKDAAEVVLNAASGYKLNLSAPASPEDGKQNYIDLAMGGGSAVGDPGAAVELLFQRTETAAYLAQDNWPLGGTHFAINNGPNGYHNWGGNAPMQQLVDDYEMMDGTKFDWDNTAHSSAPYANRDPRFYASILFDGADWKPRPSDMVQFDAVNQIQTGSYEGWDDDNNVIIIPGADTREATVENWNGSYTRYYMRKFIDPDPSLVDDQSNSQVVPWPFIRYTEMALSYAEACIEIGEDAEAQLWINRIRFRAGMPATTATGAALMDVLRNERRVELVFEEHRYHDARRWLIAPSTLGRGTKGISISGTLKPGATPHSPYRNDDSVYDYTYTVINNNENAIRTWTDAMYYRVITRDEINRNELLVQNPGH